ncbi:MAG TPA: YceI family protein, partial [Flavobacterium sp.]
MKKVTFLLLIATTFSVLVSCNKKSDDTNASDSVAATSASAESISYAVDTNNSVINWTGSKQTGKHSGILRLSDGTVFVKDGKVEGGTFVIDMNTIEVTDLKPGDGKESLEGHLKGTAAKESDHFFNVTKYPTGKFEITGVQLEHGKSTVEGNLTLKETTKNVKFPAIVTVDDNKVSIISDAFIIDRTQWKVNYGSKS